EAGTDGSGRGGVACERLLERALRLARAFQAEIRPAARRAYPRLDLRCPVSRFDHVEKLAEPLLLGEELGEREGGLSVVLLILVGDAKLPLGVVELAEPAQRDPEPKMRLPAVGILLEGVPRVNESGLGVPSLEGRARFGEILLRVLGRRDCRRDEESGKEQG